jgi:hypothetical protein
MEQCGTAQGEQTLLVLNPKPRRQTSQFPAPLFWHTPAQLTVEQLEQPLPVGLGPKPLPPPWHCTHLVDVVLHSAQSVPHAPQDTGVAAVFNPKPGLHVTQFEPVESHVKHCRDEGHVAPVVWEPERSTNPTSTMTVASTAIVDTEFRCDIAALR